MEGVGLLVVLGLQPHVGVVEGSQGWGVSPVGQPVLQSALDHVVVVQPRVGLFRGGDLVGADDDRGSELFSVLLHL